MVGACGCCAGLLAPPVWRGPLAVRSTSRGVSALRQTVAISMRELKMLTTVVEGRVYDWSHAVGRNAGAGNGFNYPWSIALASQGTAYVVNRGGEGNQGSRVSKVYIGAPGE